MNLGRDVAATLPFLREQANSRMTETWRFFTSEMVEVPGSLDDTPVETLLFVSRGRLRAAGVQAEVVESANQYAVLERLEIHVPHGSSVVPVGAFARCTASTADASLVGRVFRVAARPKAGQTTAHRYPVEEV